MLRESADQRPVPETELQMARRHLQEAELLLRQQLAVMAEMEKHGNPTTIKLGRELLDIARKIVALATAHVSHLKNRQKL
jgi:hypothetical protein